MYFALSTKNKALQADEGGHREAVGAGHGEPEHGVQAGGVDVKRKEEAITFKMSPFEACSDHSDKSYWTFQSCCQFPRRSATATPGPTARTTRPSTTP